MPATNRNPDTLGLDFGTTNSVLAKPVGGGEVSLLTFQHGGALDAVRTALAFQRSGRSEPTCDIGPWAIDRFVEAPEDTRFLQSFKSFAASAAFTDTAIFSKRFGFEDLLTSFVLRLMQHAGVGAPPKRLVVGKPVTFAGQNPNEALALKRYDAAFAALGIEEVIYVLEPVAAAFYFAQRLTSEATVLVGDFGGGTSDFSVMRFGRNGHAEALSHAGIGIAGDSFDYRIIDAVVAPRLGKHATFESWGKQLDIPLHYFASFARWNELCLMNRPGTIRELRALARASTAPAQLEALTDLIQHDSGYGLYQAVSKLKVALSNEGEVSFSFKANHLAIDQVITRIEFESWIAEDLTRIAATLDLAIAKSGLAHDRIDRVFITGGTSYVPAVRQLFGQLFRSEIIESGDQLISIAKGLALIGQSADPSRWSVTTR